MQAWLGGQKRLVKLAKHRDGRGKGGGGGGGGGAVPALPTAIEVPAAAQGAVAHGAKRGGTGGQPALPPLPHLAQLSAAVGSTHQAPAAKRRKPAPRSLDLLALQMPADWQPAGGTECAAEADAGAAEQQQEQ